MSKTEIIAELPQLSEDDRAEILERLLRLAEAGGPTEREKELLDEAQANYDANPSPGAPWKEAINP